jgi:hypothetical protein
MMEAKQIAHGLIQGFLGWITKSSTSALVQALQRPTSKAGRIVPMQRRGAVRLRVGGDALGRPIKAGAARRSPPRSDARSASRHWRHA